MSLHLQLAHRLSRSRRMTAYRKTRAAVEVLPEADLADMGIKRAQLGTLARKLALHR